MATQKLRNLGLHRFASDGQPARCPQLPDQPAYNSESTPALGPRQRDRLEDNICITMIYDISLVPVTRAWQFLAQEPVAKVAIGS